MLDIWGSSSTDVYTVGHNDQNSGLIWHFNGSGWSDIKLSTSQGGSIPGRIDLRAIQGFSSNDIWAVGMRIHQVSFSPPEKFLDSSLILHFDGVNWNEVRLPFSADMLWCIWGQSSSDLWMGGFYLNFIYHFDGSIWRRDSLPIAIPPRSDSASYFLVRSIAGNNNGEVYALGETYEPTPKMTYHFFKWSHSRWNVVDSAFVQTGLVQLKWGFNSVWASPSGTLYSAYANVFKWTESSWTAIYNGADNLRKIRGTSDLNIFAVGDFGNIFQYDGSSWYRFEELKKYNTINSSVWTNGRESFVIGFTPYFPQSTLVFHGK